MKEYKKNSFGEKIKAYRKRLNLTQEKLASELGYTKQAISNWETGKNSPSQEDISRMAQIFGTTIEEFFSDKKEKQQGRKMFELLEIKEIPNKVFTYVLFFKDHYESQFSAWVLDRDYPTMCLVDECCSKHSDFVSFRDFVVDNIDSYIDDARNFMDEKGISEYATRCRGIKEMIENHEALADASK